MAVDSKSQNVGRELDKRAARKTTRIRPVDTRRVSWYWDINRLHKLMPLLDFDCVFDVGPNAGEYANASAQGGVQGSDSFVRADSGGRRPAAGCSSQGRFVGRKADRCFGRGQGEGGPTS